MNYWLKKKATDDFLLGLNVYTCSNCETEWRYGETPFCPWCGAKMNMEENKNAEQN